jgi:hypothetical protein
MFSKSGLALSVGRGSGQTNHMERGMTLCDNQAPIRSKNIVLFKIQHHARNRYTAFYHSLQPVTYYLTTTLYQTIL